MNQLNEDALSLYSRIDATIEAHYRRHKKQPPCAKGCASCCSQFFEISDIEFSLIQDFLRTLPPTKQAMIKDNSEVLYNLFDGYWPEFSKEYFTDTTMFHHTEAYYQHPDRYKVVLPCVFLSPEGACEIYERRPIVCRTTGVGYQHLFNSGPICQVIRHSMITPLWQADLRPYKDAIHVIRWIEDETIDLGFRRQFPMFFHVYKSI